MRRATPPLILVLSLALSACSAPEEAERAEATNPSGPSPLTTASPAGSAATAPGVPAARGYALMTDVPGDMGVLLFGGFGGPDCCEFADMWTYRPGRRWTEVTPNAVPSLGFGFAYDSASERVVLAQPGGETWAFDPAANAWEARTEDGPPVWGSAMAYDAQSDRMMLVGEDQTWAYDLDRDTWEQMQPKRTPPYREFGKVAYDARSDRVVLFGGNSRAFGEPLGDTWAYDYDSDTWSEMSPSVSPPARSYSALAYDPTTDRVVLFGGSVDEETAEFDDTWAYDYDRDRWTQLEVDGPSTRAWHVMTLDEESGQILLFGGGVTRNDYTNELWIFDPVAGTWSLAS